MASSAVPPPPADTASSATTENFLMKRAVRPFSIAAGNSVPFVGTVRPSLFTTCRPGIG